MTPSQQRNLLFGLLITGFLVVIATTMIALTRSQRDIQIEAPAERAATSDGFSFFELNQSTVLARPIRNSLSQLLGPDAIAHATPIDLTIINRSFLEEHLPVLDELNQGLNPPMGERREHDTTRLTYHRAQRQNMPFRYIELVFSNVSGRPLYFIINPSDDFLNSINTLESKYGAPRIIDSGNPSSPVRIWEKEGDILVATAFPRRSGRQSQELRIYFTENLRKFVDQQIRTSHQKGSATRKAGERAF